MSSTKGLNICAIIARIKKYKSIIKKKKKKHNEIALLAKTNFDCIKEFIYRFLTDSYIERNYFDLIDVLKRSMNLKLNNKLIKTFNILIIFDNIVWSVESKNS